MKKIFILFLLTIIGTGTSIEAQNFQPGFNHFSKKKTTYLHMMDGTVQKGNLKSLDYKKGLIEGIKIRDLENNKIKIKPENINFLYIPPSGLAKLGRFMDMATDSQQWKNKDLDQNLFKDGYAYFENSDVRVKKKTRNLMMQLVNPDFSDKIKVYQDPMAGETMSIGVGPLKAGGIAKSYYVKKANEKVAVRLKKKDYDEEFAMYFADCPELIEKYGEKVKWSQFALHVYEYNTLCN
ncbi:hypothetical protein ACE939_00100 [Aquimarina sp. W85]|uniref:hypothetical protein n=1 Tax=Aquimarina rhodophyticola TaxID=3342246 RepID=UPI003671AF57